jgi:hypothetical protein
MCREHILGAGELYLFLLRLGKNRLLLSDLGLELRLQLSNCEIVILDILSSATCRCSLAARRLLFASICRFNSCSCRCFASIGDASASGIIVRSKHAMSIKP